MRYDRSSVAGLSRRGEKEGIKINPVTHQTLRKLLRCVRRTVYFSRFSFKELVHSGDSLGAPAFRDDRQSSLLLLWTKKMKDILLFLEV